MWSGEDLTYASGALYRSPVVAKVFWRGEFVGQTDVSVGGMDDPRFGATFKLQLPQMKDRHQQLHSVNAEGLKVQV